MRVLAVGAHPDDLEILCGGTLARYARDGHDVVMCHATTGDMGSFVHSREEISRIRLDEARRAAAIIGAEHVTLGLHRRRGERGRSRRRSASSSSSCGRRGPDVDHHARCRRLHGRPQRDLEARLRVQLLRDASANLETERPRHDRVTPIYYMDTIAGLGFVPTEYVDVSDVIDTKASMLEAHETQLVWLRDHDGVDIVEEMKTRPRYRGQQCGVRYAEGFIQCLTWLRGTTTRLLP